MPAFLASKSLVFDDGVYAASALAMRAGEAPFRTVFSSQGPLFLPLVWLGDLVGFRTIDSPRVIALVSGAVITVATYTCGRRLTTRARALLAAGLVTTSGSVLWVTGPANADGPALACSLLAVAFALRYRVHPTARTAVYIGLAAGAAVSIKALSVPALAAAGALLLCSGSLPTRTRARDAATAAGTAVGVYVLAALPWGVARVWEQSYSYHEQSARENTHAAAAWKIVTTAWDRDLAVLAALALAVLALAGTTLGVSRLSRRSAPDAPPHERSGVREESRDARLIVAVLVGWVALVFALLVWEPALLRAHVAHLVPPLVLLACLRPPPWRVLVVAAVLLTPFWVATNDDILWPQGYDGHAAAVVDRLRTLPDHAW